MNVKNKVLISSGVILVIILVVGSFFYLNKIRPYNQLFNNANQSMANEEYDKAVTLYSEALSYKNDPAVNKKIDFAKLLKKSKETYSIAVKQMASKDYLEAIDNFTKTDKQDAKRYFDSQNSISDCKKLYIADNLKNAKDTIAGKKFDEANKYINNILKLDAKNTDVKKLKADIVTALQKQKDDSTKLKNDIAKAAQKQKDDAKSTAKVNASKQTQNLTFQQAMDLVKSKVKLDTNETFNTTNQRFQRTGIYNGDDYYAVGKSYKDPVNPEQEYSLCLYLVNINTGAITQFTQGICTPIN